MADRIPIGSPLRTQAIINRYFLRAKKRLGQNFLVDPEAIQGIVRAAQIQPGDQVIEVGPGIGSLTEYLLLAGAKVLAYEVDPQLVPILKNELPARIAGQPLRARFKLLLKDFLQADFKTDLPPFFDINKAVKVVANLPYYITTPIIFSLAHTDLKCVSLTLMMQKEVARRLEAKPGSKAYGPLTIAVQAQMAVRLAFSVSHNSFFPRPKVDSSVVVLKPLRRKLPVADWAHFNWVVKMCFAQRRKTLNNNLKALFPDAAKRKAVIASLGVKENIRPENLTLAQFIQIADALPAK